MAVVLYIGYAIFAVLVLLIVLCAIGICRYFQDTYESSLLLTILSVISISLSMILMMLIPLDVLNVSTLALTSAVFARNTVIEVIYFVVFLAMLLLIYVVIPFCYFFYEEGQEATFREKVIGGLKYSFASMVVLIVVVVLGFVLTGSNSTYGVEPYIQKLLEDQNAFEAAVHFMIACTAFIGLVVWCTYAAFGFSWLGFSWIKGRETVEEQSETLEREISLAREQRRNLRNQTLAARINQKYKKASAEEEVGLLTRRERVLRARQEHLGAIGNCYKKCVVVTRPISIVIGIVLLLWMSFLVVCFLLGSIDKLAPSAHAYVASHRKIFNPMDSLLNLCIQVFPLDFLLFLLVVVSVWFATVSGILRLGIRFIWISLFQIKRQQTAPQGILLFSLLLMLVCITLTFMIDTLAPVYTTFGDQMYSFVNPANNATIAVQCSYSAPLSSDCTITQIQRIVTDVKFRFSFFSVVFYWANWVFFACFIGGVVLSICLKVRKTRDRYDEDDEAAGEAE